MDLSEVDTDLIEFKLSEIIIVGSQIMGTSAIIMYFYIYGFLTLYLLGFIFLVCYPVSYITNKIIDKYYGNNTEILS